MKRPLILATAAVIGFDHLRFTYSVAGENMRLSNVTKPGVEPPPTPGLRREGSRRDEKAIS